MQFNQPDTLIPDLYNPLDWNRYAYARGNPIKYTDPDGHFAIIPFIITIAVVTGVWMVAAPPAYAPSSDADLAARVTAAEFNSSYQMAEWIDEHPVAFVVLTAIAVHGGVEAIDGLAEFNKHTNDKGELYPQVTDPRTGEPIRFPEDPQWTPRDERTPRSSNYRDDYMNEWAEQGYPEPDGGWDDKKIHHIKPLEYGGDNSFDNGVPLTQSEHDQFTRWWRGGYNKPR